MGPYRVAASSTHSGVDRGWVGTKIAGRAGRAVLKPSTSFQAAKCGAGRQVRVNILTHTYHISFILHFILYGTFFPCILLHIIILTSSLWHSAHNYGLRWAGWRLGGSLLTEWAFRANQTVFSVSVPHLDAEGACRAGILGAICSPWWCNIEKVISTWVTHDISSRREKKILFYEIDFTRRAVFRP